MKRKNGFTLIELLAVIVILAIIALIATPIILNIIEKARKGAFQDSIYGIIEATKVELATSNKVVYPVTFFYSEGKLYDSEGKEIKMNGKIANGTGEIIYHSANQIELALHNDTYCGKSMIHSDEVIVTDFKEQCAIVELDYTPDKCFTFDETTGTIKNYNKKDEDCGVDIVIPEKINGVTVKTIGYGAFEGDSNHVSNGWFCTDASKFINSVVFPSGLETIENNAFRGYVDGTYCSTTINRITELDFSRARKLKKIGDYAFYNNQLTSVEIPNSVTSIGTFAFYGNQLTNVEIPSGIASLAYTSFPSTIFSEHKQGDFIVVNNILLDYIGTEKEITIPSNITSIGAAAFSYNELTSVVIGDSVTSIGNSAFYYNDLTSVEIPNSVTSIGDSSFYNNQLTSLTLGNSVTSIGDSAFQSNKLTSVVIPESVTSIGDRAFSWNKLTSVVIPESVTSIESYAFESNKLTSIEIPNSVTNIGDYAFRDNQLTSVEIPSSVKSLKYSSFPSAVYSAYKQGDFVVVNNILLKYIGNEKEITIPSNITSIENEAFSSKELTSVVIPNSVTSIGNSAFSSNKLTSITIPNSVTSIGSYAFYSNQLTSVIISENTKTIGEFAFYSNQLTSVKIPDSVTSIGKSAFNWNQLTNVTIPNSVTSIGSAAFSNNKLTSVTIKGKSSSTGFYSYPNSSPFGWADGYSDSNIIWNG